MSIIIGLIMLGFFISLAVFFFNIFLGLIMLVFGLIIAAIASAYNAVAKWVNAG